MTKKEGFQRLSLDEKPDVKSAMVAHLRIDVQKKVFTLNTWWYGVIDSILCL